MAATPSQVGGLILIACLLLSCTPSGSTSTTEGLPPVDPARLAEHRRQWLLDTRPEQVISVAAARAKVAAGSASAAGDNPTDSVAVEGRIGGAKYLQGDPTTTYPWEPGKACFMMADLALDAESHDHSTQSDDGCPFCARKARHGSALVRFLVSRQPADKQDGDKQLGDTVPADMQPVDIDARSLFALTGHEHVVVVGRPYIDALDQLVIDAEAIFVGQ